MAVLLLLSLNANAAGIIAEMPNQGGGNISLTDIKCTTIKDTFVAYSNLVDGRSILGCWASDEDNVFVRWSDGDIRQYSIWSFVMKKRYVNGKWI
jgi:hypothetical protein